MSAEPAENQPWDHYIAGLRAGDTLLVRQFCLEYGPQLERIADKRLQGPVARRVGADDVVQSVCRTFLRRAQGGEFDLPDSEGMWALLCAITLTKLREQMRFHLRQRRGVDREAHLDSLAAKPGATPIDPAGSEQSPASLVEFSDTFEQLIAELDPEERMLVDLKLQQCTGEEIAERMGCSERTVRRMLKKVQSRLARHFEVAE